MGIIVRPNQFYKSESVWVPNKGQFNYIRKILEPLPFDTTIYILISDKFGSEYTLKPSNTLILNPRQVNKKDVIIHEFGHHIWHKLLNNRQRKMWKDFVDKQGDVFKRKGHNDIYNENLAHVVEYIWGKSTKRIKNIEKANLLANFLLKILGINGVHMKNLAKELQRKGFKQLAAKVQSSKRTSAQDETKQSSLADLQSAIIKFIKDNPNAKDAEVHNLAKQLGVEPNILEDATYKLLGDLIKGVGKHIDISDKEYDPKQLAMGIKIEHEHTDNDALAKEIAKDHLSEISDYYTRLVNMEKEAKS